MRSVEFAFDQSATATSLIPVRGGNGALEVLAERGDFAPPRLATLEGAFEQGLRLGRGRVFADLWEVGRLSACADCFPARAARLREMNLTQAVLPPVSCTTCGENG